MTERRRFEFSEGSSNKFWEVWVDGSDMKTCYGKIGTSGSVTLKGGGSPEGAVKLMAKLIAEKTKKGYAEVGGGAAAAAPAPAPAPKPAAAPKKAAAKAAPKDEDEDEDEEGDDEGDGAGGAWRRFEVDEKFWMIKIDGSSHTVKYGKIGANGAEKTKDFGDDAAAKKDYDKLVKEKTGKGYEEITD
jgi:predicted DNA-binding WGR domain protein